MPRKKARESGQPDDDRGHRAMATERLARQKHQQRGADRADEIAKVDDAPHPQQFAEPDPPRGPGHHHQGITSEKFGAADDHQDEPETENHTRQ
jgi:hypothetical protein